MDLEKLKSIFPLEGEITQEILDVKKTLHCNMCPGALTLKEALEKAGFEGIHPYINWGVHDGFIMKEPLFDENGQYLDHEYIYKNEEEIKAFMDITTFEEVNFMDNKQPRKVTFIIKKIF